MQKILGYIFVSQWWYYGTDVIEMSHIKTPFLHMFPDMPRTKLGPSPKGKRRNWKEDDMARAIQAVRQKKHSVRDAAKYWNVPKSTLHRLMSEPESPLNIVAATKLGRKPVLPAQLEEELVQYLLQMEKTFYGLTRNDVRRIAYQLAAKNNISHPFSNGLAGRAWFDHFMNRFKDRISIRRPTGTSFARAVGFTKESVSKFYDILEDVYDKNLYEADRIYNVDETGLSVVQSKIPQIVGLKGKRQIGALTSAERGALVTAILSMSAGGSFVPPMLIFPRVNWTEQLMKGAPPGAIGACHPSGWVQTDLFTRWFLHFVQKTKPSADSPVLLILDGHFSHTRNLEVINIARENHVTIVSLPPHSSHKMQPLDRTLMSPLKTYYSEEIRMRLRQSQSPLSPYDIAELFSRAYLKTQTGEIAVNGFRVTGIYPLNRTIFTEAEFIEHRRTSGEQQTPVRDPDDGQMLQNPPRTEPIGHKNYVIPHDISPVPALKKTTSNRGRKTTSAAVITGSPYKSAIEVSRERIKQKEASGKCRQNSYTQNNSLAKDQPSSSGCGTKKKQRRIMSVKGKGKQINREQSSDSEDADMSISSGDTDVSVPVHDSTPGERDAECMFCGENFTASRPHELWIKCEVCSRWAHIDCSACETDKFVCDFCE